MLTLTYDSGHPGTAPSAAPPERSSFEGGAPLIESWARYVRRHWPQVSITDADVRAKVVNGRKCRSASAYVHLGKLLPLDVEVRVTRAGKRMDGRGNGALAPEGEWPLFSVAALHNGCYKYEGDVPCSSEDDECFWTVSVTPARAIGGIQPASLNRTIIDAPERRARSSSS